MMIYYLVVLSVAGLIGSGWFAIQNHKNRQRLISTENRIQYLQAQLDAKTETETRIARQKKIQEEYDALMAKVKDLNLAAQNLGTQPTIEEQIEQLEEFFKARFKKMPPQIPVFCKRLRGLIAADQRIKLLHSQVMRPLQGMLYMQEVTDDPEVQRLILARMIDALWLSYDIVETLADRDNMREEQRLALEFLNGTMTRPEILLKAKPITTDPEQTSKWLRVIRRAVLPLNLDSQYPVLYSGHKLVEEPTSIEKDNTNK